VSEDGTRLTAIVDWADAAIADPAADLAGLAIWLGPAFVREVLRSYEGPADEGTYHRAVFLARAGLLGFLDGQLAGTSEPAPVAMLDAQLRAVFREEAPARR
ncbi:MAG TPA: phosphotransferase, partial [Actinomycetota bacterium]|nr:phosphotransferase [Actinomycetota bacterium]